MSDTADVLDALERAMPIKLSEVQLKERGVGLVIVDEVNGFATVGAGYLAPPVENPQVTRMIAETNARAERSSPWRIRRLRRTCSSRLRDLHATGPPRQVPEVG